MHRRWFISRTDPEFIQSLSRAASISPLLARILINRGIKSPSAARDFLAPSLENLTDPFDLPDMAAAVKRIKAAIRQGDKVLIHGDYGTDGLTATAIMVQALRKTGLEVYYFIPHRMVHGYGFNGSAVDEAKRLGVKLIITVDCGITSLDAAAYAKAAAIDVIITDHHEPLKRSGISDHQSAAGNELVVPEAVAVVNPKLSSQETPSSNLSGAGIAFRVIQALAMEDAGLSPADTMDFLDLAALGTVADVVSLTGDNRIIVKEGLRHIHNAARPAIKSLKEVCGLNGRDIKAGHLSYSLVPRINAAGRVSDSSDVVRLFLSDSDEEAMELSEWLNRLNSERQQIEEQVYQEALVKLNALEMDSVIVLSGAGWHQGVLGIVASRIAEEFYRPAFILTVQNGVAKGSARSIPSFDICKGLAGCADLLLSFGGHKQAAGVKLEAVRVPDFVKVMGDIFRKTTGEKAPVHMVEIDIDIKLHEVTHALLNELAMLEPVGHGNAEPVFGAKNLYVVAPRIVGRNHLKMKLKKNSHLMDAIGFDMGLQIDKLNLPSAVDAAFTPAVNEWNGRKYLQLVLKAVRPAV